MTYVVVAALLGLLVFVHELGHFLAAKAVGIPVARFSLGIGPVLVSRTVGGVRYCLSAVPFGGYVLPDLRDEAAYLALPLGKRLIFSLAGPLANILFALAVKPLALCWKTLAGMVAGLGALFSRPEQLSGVVGIVAEGSRFAGSDLTRHAILAAHLSLSLAVFNLLPLPPLDGGKMVFDTLARLWSGLSRLYIPVAVGGWLALIGLMGYATVQDVWKYCL